MAEEGWYFESPQYVRLPGRGVAGLYNALMVVFVLSNAILLLYEEQHKVVDRHVPGHFMAKLEPPDQPLSIAGLAYCQPNPQPEGPDAPLLVQARCDLADPVELFEARGSSAFVTTAWYSVNQTRVCGRFDHSCPSGRVWATAPGTTAMAYTARPEDHYLVIEHSLGVSAVHGDKFSGPSCAFRGRLARALISGGGWLAEYDSGCRREARTYHDRLPLRDLLQAAGVGSLDNFSHYYSQEMRHESTHRQSGIHLSLGIRYSNLQTPNGALQYRYSVARTGSDRARIRSAIAHPDGTRTLLRRFGVHLTIHMAAEVGDWSVFSLLNHVVLPSVSMTSLVAVFMYYSVVLWPGFAHLRGRMVTTAVVPPSGKRD